jgi:hypothetical protein
MKLFLKFTTNRKVETKWQNETAGERRRLPQDLSEQGSQRTSSDREETANCLPNHREQCVANDRAGTAGGDARALKDKKAQESILAPQTRAPPKNARCDQSGTFQVIDDSVHLFIKSDRGNRLTEIRRKLRLYVKTSSVVRDLRLEALP